MKGTILSDLAPVSHHRQEVSGRFESSQRLAPPECETEIAGFSDIKTLNKLVHMDLV